MGLLYRSLAAIDRKSVIGRLMMLDGTYHFPSGSDIHHSGPGKDYSDGVNSQLIQLTEIGDFGCRESESVLLYAARKT